MTRLDRIQIISEKHGASLPEYVVLDIISNFGMSAEEVAGYASKILQGSPYEKASCCEAAVASCVARFWLAQRGCLLVLTDNGSVLRKTISKEVRQLPA
jgi:hypothetical protein